MDYIILIIIGLVAGAVGGMLGVGGSVVMIPAMTEFIGPNQHLYQAAAMIVNFFVVVPAMIQHRRANAIEASTVKRLLPLALLAVVVGVILSELPFFAGPGEAYLRGIFGLFLLAISLYDVYRLIRGKRPDTADETPIDHTSTISVGKAAIVALPTGLVAGLLGVGGGIMAVPLQRRFLGLPIRTAIANSATLIIATSFVGAMAKNSAYMAEHNHSTESLVLAAILIPTAIVGSLFGSRMTHRLPLPVVKGAFMILLAIAAVRLTYRASIDMSNIPVAQSLRRPHRPATHASAPPQVPLNHQTAPHRYLPT